MKILPLAFPKSFHEHKINDLCIEIERLKRRIKTLEEKSQ